MKYADWNNEQLVVDTGTNEDTSKTCMRCKKRVPVTADYCPFCGANFKTEPITTVILPEEIGEGKKGANLKRIAISLGVLLCVGIGVILHSAKNKTKGPDSNLYLGNRYLLSGENDNAISSLRILEIESSVTQTERVNSMEVVADISETPFPLVQAKPFYGIWCFASKDQWEAEQVADDLKDRGFDGQVFVSSEWSNLNPEKWYCLSAGACATESEAEAVLSAAHNAGYSDAYIKYSGNCIG